MAHPILLYEIIRKNSSDFLHRVSTEAKTNPISNHVIMYYVQV